MTAVSRLQTKVRELRTVRVDEDDEIGPVLHRLTDQVNALTELHRAAAPMWEETRDAAVAARDLASDGARRLATLRTRVTELQQHAGMDVHERPTPIEAFAIPEMRAKLATLDEERAERYSERKWIRRTVTKTVISVVVAFLLGALGLGIVWMIVEAAKNHH